MIFENLGCRLDIVVTSKRGLDRASDILMKRSATQIVVWSDERGGVVSIFSDKHVRVWVDGLDKRSRGMAVGRMAVELS